MFRNYFMAPLWCLLFTVFAACSGQSNEDLENNDIENTDKDEEKEDDEEKIEDRGFLIYSDLNESGGADLNYKRGFAGPGVGGFYNTTNNINFISQISSWGIDLFVACHNYYREETPKYNELYNWTSRKHEAALCDEFLNIRVHSYLKGVELVNIMGSCPKGYRIDPDYIVEDIDQPLPDDMMVGGETESPMSTFQRVLPEYINMAEKEIGKRLGLTGYHSIWCGSDEPAHSIGDPPTGLNDAARISNIKRYVDFWKPIEQEIHRNGGKVGGIQLNSANERMYLDAAKIMVEKGLKIDFFTLIFYQFGNLQHFDKAIEALDYYNKNSEDDLNTKLIILRGSYAKPATTSFCRYLQGERFLMDHADKVFSYSLDAATNGAVGDPVVWDCRVWMATKLGNKRHPLTNLPENVNGFVTTKGNKVVAALWNFKDNNGSCEQIPSQTLSLELKNVAFNKETSKLRIRRFKGYYNEQYAAMEYPSSAKWDKKTNRIVNIDLNADEFVLIELG